MKTKSMSAAALLITLATSSAAFAESFGNPAGLSPDTPGIESARPAPDHANAADRLFVRQAAIGGQAEVDLGKLAQQKASSPQVREFANRMVADHGKSNERLLRTGRELKAELPKDGQKIDLDPEHKNIRTEIERASGTNFDVAYLTSQIQDHQKTANLLQWQIGNGQNEALKKYAADTLPVVLEHLEMAKHHFAELTSSPPPR